MNARNVALDVHVEGALDVAAQSGGGLHGVVDVQVHIPLWKEKEEEGEACCWLVRERQKGKERNMERSLLEGLSGRNGLEGAGGTHLAHDHPALAIRIQLHHPHELNPTPPHPPIQQ